MAAICRQAQAALTALPRIGLGAGGALAGDRAGSEFIVRRAIELPCAYATGPSFRLTPEERVNARETLPPYGVIGWYCSKPRGKAEPDQHDRELFADLFPGAWKLLLIIQPTLSSGTRGVMYFRNGNGELTSAGERVFFDFDDAPVPYAVPAVDAAPAMDAAPLVAAEPAMPETAAAIIQPRAQELPQPVPFRTPVFSGYDSERAPASSWRSRSWRSMLGWILVALLLVAISAGAWITRDLWWPRPTLTLTLAPVAGSLEIRWNPDALRGLGSGSMSISDGGVLKQIPLDARQMILGVLVYQPDTDHVIATIHAGDLRARTEFDRKPPR